MAKMLSVSELAKLDLLSIEQKFTRAIVDLRKIRPFYASIFECMNKEVRNNQIDTMAVTVDSLIYNSVFVEKLKYDEFLFIILHELAHVGLKHVVRGIGKEPMLWNIAADYYVNKLIAEEFNFNTSYFPSTVNTTAGVKITLPDYLLFLSSVDLDVDSVETLYEKLLEQKEEQEQAFENNISQSGEGDGSQDNDGGSQDGKGDASQDSEGDDSQDNDGDDSQDNDGGGSQGSEGDDSQDGEGDGSQDGEGDGSQSGQTYHFRISGSGFNGDLKGVSDLKVDSENYESDLINESLKSKEELNSDSDQLLRQAKMYFDLANKDVGTEVGNLYRKVEMSLKSKVNWKSVLKQFLRKHLETDTSYSKPDKRFMYQGNIILPGLIEDDLSKFEGVKFCIDVSGSITNKELDIILGQVYKICKSFSVSGEIIYWDHEIASKGSFNTFKELSKVERIGGGGTDVNCLYDYFNSKECKDKPIAILIFTDGYLHNNYDSTINMKKYSKNTIWVMSKEHKKDFKPIFGKLVYSKV